MLVAHLVGMFACALLSSYLAERMRAQGREIAELRPRFRRLMRLGDEALFEEKHQRKAAELLRELLSDLRDEIRAGKRERASVARAVKPTALAAATAASPIRARSSGSLRITKRQC